MAPEFLQFACPGTHWDGTLGLAGHLIAYLKKYPQSRALGSDADKEMLRFASKEIQTAGLLDRVTLEHFNFAEVDPNREQFNSIFLDLGISSLHLDELGRGISFRYDEELDMRLDKSNGEPVWCWLENASEYDIRKVINEYGEEKAAPRIARAICKARETGPIQTTLQLSSIITKVLPPGRQASSHTGRYPQVKTFQAFRIFINRELENLSIAMKKIPALLHPGGRLIVISFHSLEDRIVKRAFRALERIEVTDPAARSNWKEGDYSVLTPKPIKPSDEETARNPRARSARMRVLERKT